MADPTPLPPGLPDSLTFLQLREAIAAFGYKLVMVPADKRKPPPGFAVPDAPIRIHN